MRVGQNTSQLLIPLAFAAHAGALLALTGSPVSVIVSEAAADAGIGQFGFFEFALTGIPLLVGTIVIVVALGPKLLPHRNAARMPADLLRSRIDARRTSTASTVRTSTDCSPGDSARRR